jgi:hypothetical protein
LSLDNVATTAHDIVGETPPVGRVSSIVVQRQGKAISPLDQVL